MRPEPTADYRLCGWRLHSQLPFPELQPWDGDDRAADLRIRLGSVNELTDAVAVNALVRVDGRGRMMIEDAGIPCRIVVDASLTATVETTGAPDWHRVRLRLLSFLLAFAGYHRGALPLHAEAVEVEGRTIALCGPSGVGKSTLAAALAARGHTLLCDDIAMVRVEKGGSCALYPSLAQLKLTPPAARALNMDGTGLPLSGRERAKALVRLDQPASTHPRRLSALVLLDGIGAAPALSRLSAFQVLGRRHDFLYRPTLALGLSETDLSKRFLALLSGVPVHGLTRPMALDRLNEVVQTVEDLARRLPHAATSGH